MTAWPLERSSRSQLGVGGCSGKRAEQNLSTETDLGPLPLSPGLSL